MSPSETPKNLNEIADPEVKQRVIACINEFYEAYPEIQRSKVLNYYLTEFIIDGRWQPNQIRTPRFMEMFKEEREDQINDIWEDVKDIYKPLNTISTVQKLIMIEKILTIYENNYDFPINEQMIVNAAKYLTDNNVDSKYINDNTIRDDLIRHAKDPLIPA